MAPPCSRYANWAEPEVYFRVTHVTLDGGEGSAYRQQEVEIALGPKGAFENGNVGTLTRRVPADRVVSAVPPPRGKPRPPRVARLPQGAQLLRKALGWNALLVCGEVQTQAEIARREGISRARVTQILGFLRLAPEIQERILALPPTVVRSVVSGRRLRPITALDHEAQHEAFERLLGGTGGSK